MALAQLQVELNFDQETYLPRETIPAKVVVRNSSGQTLALGSDPHWLRFDIENVDGNIVGEIKPVDVSGEFSLPSAHRGTKIVDLTPFFELKRFGRYKITATVHVAEWNRTFVSKPAHFGINTGVKLWETTFGVASEDDALKRHFRKYQLVQANHLKRLSLYVRLMDEDETETLKIYPLGEVISFNRPETMLDSYSNLHVLFQSGAHSFRYCVITPEGLMLTRETYDQTTSRPTLEAAAEGRVKLTGGVRRLSPTDLPPPDLAEASAKNDEPIEAVEYFKKPDAPGKPTIKK